MPEPLSNIAKRFPSVSVTGLWLGPAAFLAMLWLGAGLDPENPLVGRMAAIALLMAIWWITEAVPLAATALVPLVLFPLTGIMSGVEVAPVYFNYIIFLFLGGFMIALAMERWNLHRRIALRIIAFTGTKPSRLVLGFMLATAFLSMWISNTATSIMMLAIGLAVIKQEEETFGAEATAPLSAALLLGIAYSASVGGIATLVGTPPNLALVRLFEIGFPGAEEAGYRIAFGQWMLLGVPLSAVMLVVVWLVLTRVCHRCPDHLELAPDVIREERRSLGPMGFEEKAVAAVFVGTAVLWIFRADLQVGNFTLPGWAGLLPFGGLIDDGTVAVAMALILFLIPAKRRPDQAVKRTALLDAAIFTRIPWHIILLFGGGFALARGFQESGLSLWIGARFAGIENAPTPLLIASVSGGITFLTELTSNTATTQMILPPLASTAVEAGIHPLMLMVPAALAASCAFMMPVATPPNAIVFASGRLRIIQMVKAGLILNLLGVVVITTLFLLLGPAVFDIDREALPDWARQP